MGSKRECSEASTRELSLYVHVPFCSRKCAYCNFYSVCGYREHYDTYLQALKLEWELIRRDRRLDEADVEISTIYVGGGTPSILGPARLGRLIEVFREEGPDWAEDCEISAEVNPEGLTVELVEGMMAAGYNRISVGVQSFRDEELKLLGRISNAEQTRTALRNARAGQCDNLSLDLIYGLPAQTAESWAGSLEEAISIEPEHISCYLLSVEEKTELYQQLMGGVIHTPLDELLLEEYTLAGELLSEAGYRQYEISNFARRGFSCRHNIATWEGKAYLGLGPSAHSFDGEARWRNVGDIDEYFSEIIEAGRRPIRERYRLGPDDPIKECILLGLRLADGVPWTRVEQLASPPVAQRLRSRAKFLVGTGFLAPDRDRLRLSPQAYFVSNSVIVELLRALEETTP